MKVIAVLAVCAGLVLGAFHVGQHRQCEWNKKHHTIYVHRYCGR